MTIMTFLPHLMLVIAFFATACGGGHSSPSADADADADSDWRGAEGPYPVQVQLAHQEPTIVQAFLIGNELRFSGDVVVGSRQGLASALAAMPEGPEVRGFGLAMRSTLWPSGEMAYVIDPSVGDGQRQAIEQAMAHWRDKTGLKFVVRTGEADYARFHLEPSYAGICTSYVGRLGGEQPIALAAECDVSAIIHEIGHAFGLHHEQHRPDRDQFIDVHWENIDPAYHSQFQIMSFGATLGAYDLKSSMHYYSTAFSLDGKPSMTTKDGGMIPDNAELSPGDVAAIHELYGIDPPVEDPAATLANETLTLVSRGLAGCSLKIAKVDSFDPRRTAAVEIESGGETKRFFVLQDFSALQNAKMIAATIPRFFFKSCHKT